MCQTFEAIKTEVNTVYAWVSLDDAFFVQLQIHGAWLGGCDRVELREAKKVGVPNISRAAIFARETAKLGGERENHKLPAVIMCALALP